MANPTIPGTVQRGKYTIPYSGKPLGQGPIEIESKVQAQKRLSSYDSYKNFRLQEGGAIQVPLGTKMEFIPLASDDKQPGELVSLTLPPKDGKEFPVINVFAPAGTKVDILVGGGNFRGDSKDLDTAATDGFHLVSDRRADLSGQIERSGGTHRVELLKNKAGENFLRFHITEAAPDEPPFRDALEVKSELGTEDKLKKAQYKVKVEGTEATLIHVETNEETPLVGRAREMILEASKNREFPEQE
jgi:hypothetical protein